MMVQHEIEGDRGLEQMGSGAGLFPVITWLWTSQPECDVSGVTLELTAFFVMNS